MVTEQKTEMKFIRKSNQNAKRYSNICVFGEKDHK